MGQKILQACLVAVAAAGVLFISPTAEAGVLSCSRECALDEVCTCRALDSRFSGYYGGARLFASGRERDILIHGAAPARSTMDLVGFTAIGLQADGSRAPGCLLSAFGQVFVADTALGVGPTCDTAVTLIVHIAVDE